jgi:hypothetical protein
MPSNYLRSVVNARKARTFGLAFETGLRLFGCILLQLSCLLVVTVHTASADTVGLTNGDKLTCEIKKLEDGKLTVTLGYADDTELTFDWKMVSAITSENSLKMQLDDGTELTAKLQPVKEPGQLLPQGSPKPLALSRVVSLETAESETSWTDNLSLDTDFTWGYTGSDSLHTISLNTQNFYWGDKWEFALLGSENTNSFSSLPISFNHIQGQSNVNRYLVSRFFVFPWALGLHVTQQSIAPHAGAGGYGSEWQLGGGGGWSFIKQKDHHLELMAGMVELSEKATVFTVASSGQRPSTSVSQQSPAFLLATRWQRTSEDGFTWLVQGLYTHPTKTDMRSQMGFQFNFSIPIKGPVSADVNVQDYTSPLESGILGTRGLSVSTGFGLHF